MDRKNNKGMTVMIIAAVLLIVALIAVSVRLYHYFIDKMDQSSSSPALSSEETARPAESASETPEPNHPSTSSETPSETVPPSYPAESLPDYEVHTLPTTTEEPTTEPWTTEEPTTAAPETTAPDTSPAAESTEAPETSAEPLLSETSTEFSENSDNLPYIGTWRLEYDLAPAQAEALNSLYSLPRIPEKPVILRLFAELHDDGTLRVVFTQEDADAFKTALSGWYGDAASIYAESGANAVQRAAFASWAAYRKGLYALLSPDAVGQAAACWHAEGSTVYVTDDGEVQAEISAVFEGGGLTVTDISVKNEDFRDTVSLMQSTLGFTAPYHLVRD